MGLKALVLATLVGSQVLASPVHQLHKPLHKRDVVVNHEIEYVTVTVTGRPAAPTVPAFSQPEIRPHPAVANFGQHKTEEISTETSDSDTTPATPSGGASSGGSAGMPSFSGEYKNQVIETHKYLRSLHGAGELAWDEQLAADAYEGASKCVFEHDLVGTNSGQNIGIGHSESDVGKFIYGMYTKEVNKYTSYGADSGISMDTAHFSQIVWDSTHSVGCATVECPGGVAKNPSPGDIPPILTFCNYKEAGNMAGAYAENVKAPLGQAAPLP